MSSSDRQAILAANEAFYRAFEKKDLEAMAAVWSQGISSLCVHPGRKVLQGWEDIQFSWEQIFRNTRYLEIETEILAIEQNENLAYVILRENLLQVVGRRRVQAQSMATNLFERMGDRWYLIHHHGSPIAQ